MINILLKVITTADLESINLSCIFLPILTNAMMYDAFYGGNMLSCSHGKKVYRKNCYHFSATHHNAKLLIDRE